MTSSISMRPTSWDCYLGQDKLKTDLGVRIAAAVRQERVLDHVLMIAPPGYGKTSLARLMAAELGQEFATFVMPLPADKLKNILRVGEGCCLLLDEFHRLKVRDQENLLSVVEDGYWQDGYKRVEIPPLTIIAATTEAADVIPALQRRFKIRPHFVPYTDEEMALVARQMASRVDLTLTDDGAGRIGRAGAGSPSQVEDLILSLRDLGPEATIEDVLGLCNLTPDGLNPHHITYLEILGRHAPVGMDVLSSTMRQAKPYVMNLERTLDRMNLIERTPQGRQLSPSGYLLLTRSRSHG